VRAGALHNHPAELIRNRIRKVLRVYARACGIHSEEKS